ncbi:hypothetical protein HK100_001415, partial [Physocladia obscura]
MLSFAPLATAAKQPGTAAAPVPSVAETSEISKNGPAHRPAMSAATTTTENARENVPEGSWTPAGAGATLYSGWLPNISLPSMEETLRIYRPQSIEPVSAPNPRPQKPYQFGAGPKTTTQTIFRPAPLPTITNAPSTTTRVPGQIDLL